MRPMDIPVSHLPNVIFACFVLHNFCERENVDVDKQVVEQVIQEECCGIIKVDKLNSYITLITKSFSATNFWSKFQPKVYSPKFYL